MPSEPDGRVSAGKSHRTACRCPSCRLGDHPSRGLGNQAARLGSDSEGRFPRENSSSESRRPLCGQTDPGIRVASRARETVNLCGGGGSVCSTLALPCLASAALRRRILHLNPPRGPGPATRMVLQVGRRRGAAAGAFMAAERRRRPPAVRRGGASDYSAAATVTAPRLVQ